MIYLVVLTRLYVPARAAKISAFVQLFEALGSLRGRAVARDAQKRSWVGMFLICILSGDGVIFPTLSSLYSSYLHRR